jgi:hypothetical protein
VKFPAAVGLDRDGRVHWYPTLSVAKYEGVTEPMRVPVDQSRWMEIHEQYMKDRGFRLTPQTGV